MASIIEFLSEYGSILATVTCGAVVLVLISAVARNRRLLRDQQISRRVAAEDRRSAQSLVADLKENIRALKDESRALVDLSFKLPVLMRQLTVDLERRSQGPLILKVLDEMFSPSQALVFFADEMQEVLTLVAETGSQNAFLEDSTQIRVGDGHIGFAARKQIVMDAHDFRLESNLEREHISRTSLAGVKPDLCAPLVSNGRLFGAISMGMPRKWASVEIKRLFGMVADVGALAISSHLQYREIRQLANSDPLTRIANKGYFMEKAGQIVEDARGVGRETALLMIDVDHFKEFNDTYGHLSGDRVLRGIGSILRQHVREGDIAARFGGEEFIVLLRAADGKTACRVAERVSAAIRESDYEGLLSETSARVTASVGVSVFPEDGTQLSDLIGKADIALYESKEGGRDIVRRYGQAAETEEEEALPVEDTAAETLDDVDNAWDRAAEPEPEPGEPEPDGSEPDEPEPDGEEAPDFLGALRSGIAFAYDEDADEHLAEEEGDDESVPPPLTTTIYDMTTGASEAS